MAMQGTLDEVLEKLFELYMQNRIDEPNSEYFLSVLKHPNGELVFGVEDIVKMLDMLREAKEEKDEF